jgi:PAS domain S-box-containing protein
VGVVGVVAVLLLLYLLSRSNYLLFHSIIELFAIVVGFAIFVVAWNTRRWVSNDYLLFLGLAFLFVAIVDVFHTLAYRGMGVFPGFGSNEPTQFWILARYIQAFSLLAAPVFLTHRLRLAPVAVLYALVTGFGLLSICRLGIFPDCFVEGQGLTTFKVASEYAISAVLVGGIVYLSRHRKSLEPGVFRLLVAAMVATISAEMSFTLYTDVYGVANMVGHLLKVVSFYLVYRAVVVTSLATPYETLFREVSRSRDEARMYLDMAGTMLLAFDLDGKVRLLNHRGAEVLGYTEEEMLGRDWFAEFLPPVDRVRVRQVFDELLSGDTASVEYFQNHVLTRDGGERLIAWHNTVLRDSSGVVAGALVSGEDITDRRAAEERLIESEKRFRFLFEHAPDAYYLSDLEGRFVDANRAAEELVGHRKADLLGRTLLESGLLLPGEMGQAIGLLERSARGESTGPDELTLIRKDGNPAAVEIRTEPVEIEGRPLVLGIARDTTARKQAEQQVRLQRDYFMSLFSNSPEAIALLDEDYRVADVNAAFSELFGYDRDAALGKPIDALIVPEGREHEATELTRQVRSGQSGTLADTVRRKRDGALVAVSIADAPIVSGGRTVGVFAMYRDITERKRAEDVIRASEEKFRALFEQSIDAIYVHAYDGSNLEANQAWLDMFGWTEEELPFIDSARDVYVDPHDRDDFLRRIEESGIVADEVRFKKKDGTVIICQRTVVARRDEAGRIVSLQGIIRDITERKNAEEATLRSEARLRSLVSILQHEADTVQDFVDYALNEAIALTESKIGYIYFYDEERREFTLNTWSRDVMKECSIREAQTVYRLEKTGIWGEAVRQRRPIVVNDFAAPHPLKKGYPEGHAALRKYATVPVVSSGQIVAVVGVANKETDYTDTDVLQLTLLMDSVWKEVERKQIQEQVRQFSQRLEHAMSAGSLAWWQMALPSGKVVFDDRKATMLGYSPSDFSHYSDFTALLHPDDLEKAMQAMRDHLEGSAERYEVEYRIRTSSGEYRWFRDVGGVTERDSEGKPSLVTGIVVDITGLKSAEERLAESNRDLRNLAARLDVAREEERASVAWELHDEVSQALSVIRLDITSCSGQLPAGVQIHVKPTMDRMVEMLDSTIARLRRLYTDLVPVMLEDLGLAAAIEWQTEQFAGGTAVAVRVGRVEDLTLRDERTTLGLFRILQELLNHMSTHPGTTKVTVDLEREDSHAVLRVTDDGDGFPSAEYEESCVMVLAGVRERARFWGGEISVGTEPSRGTVVSVTAPLRSD